VISNSPESTHVNSITSNSSDGCTSSHDFESASFDSVIDMYNPFRPNDYIKYCAERIEKKRLLELQEESNKRLDELAKERAERDAKLKQARDDGDMAKVQSLVPQFGMGRGRGLSNLPAWMTAASLNGGSNDSINESDAKKPKTASFDERNYEDNKNDIVSTSIGGSSIGVPVVRRRVALSSPSCVLLLRNMVVRGEVDE
jgi:hypothetical protein